MSEDVRDLLVGGKAAAKAKDIDEARFYLRWVLRRPDADPDQEAEAWYWLSETTDVPEQKRDCLHRVLEIEPNDPRARQSLAILEGRLKPKDIVDHRQPIKLIKPLSTPEPAQVRRYVCPQCGGGLAFDAGRQALVCDHCGHQMEKLQAVVGGDLEQDFWITLPTARAHRWELPTSRVLKCKGCSASFALPPTYIAGDCPFCQSSHVIETTESRELIQPDGVLPFQSTPDGAVRRMRKWLKELRFCPDDLTQKAATVPPRAVYLPFWTFDVGGEVRVYKPPPPSPANGKAAYPMQYKTSVSQGGAFDRYPVMFDDLLAPATISLPPELVSQLTDFGTTALLPYSPELLADWPAQVYQVTLANASLVARQRALELTKKRLSSFGGTLGYSISSSGIVIHSYKLVLLPVWVMGYRYKGKHYLVLVNDQTGKAAGQLPRSGFQQFMAGIVHILQGND